MIHGKEGGTQINPFAACFRRWAEGSATPSRLYFQIPDPNFPSLKFADLIDALYKAQKPAILVCQQIYPPKIVDRVGLFGGQMTALFKTCGVVGVITNGPSRDLDEIRPLEVQYIMSGVTPAHGDLAIRAINIPVSVAGMDVVSGDIVHMDEHGAVKFAADQLENVCKNIDALSKHEENQAMALLGAKTLEELKEAWMRRI